MAVAAILAGGTARRLGGAKATVPLRGRPLLSWVIDAARAGGLEPVVVAKDGSPLPPLDCRLIVEPTLPAHPLCGIAAALSELGEEAIVVCACDMPFLSGELLAWLATRSEPLAIAAPGGRAQPLLGRYAAQLLDGLEAALAEELPMREAARRLGAVEIADTELGRFGDPQRLCANINTPAELAAAGG